MDIEIYVYELRGYLRSLQRLSKVHCHFFADSFPIQSGLSESIEKYVARFGDDFEFCGSKTIDYSDVEGILKDHLYSNLTITDENQLGLLDWDITEYFGLASTSVDPNGDFNPLVRKGAVEVKIASKHYQSCAHFVVPIGEHAIFVGLAVCA